MAAPPTPISDFFTRHTYSKPALSPSGRYLAVLAPVRGDPDRNQLDIIDLQKMKAYRTFSLDGRQIFSRFAWASDDRIVLSTAIRIGAFDEPFSTGMIYVIDVQGDRLRLVQQSPTLLSYTHYRIANLLPDDPDHAITVSSSQNRRPHAFLVDLEHRDSSLLAAQPRRVNQLAREIAASPLKTGTLETDHAGKVRLARGYDKATEAHVWSYRDGNSDPWKRMPAKLLDPALGAQPIGFAPDNKDIYLLEFGDSGAQTLGFYKFNPDTGRKQLVYDNPDADVEGVMYGPEDGRAVALTLTPGRPQIVLLHKDGPAARILKGFSASFPGEFPAIVSWSRGGSEAIVEISSARDSGRFYLVDTRTLKAKFLFKQRPTINPGDMAPVKPIKFKARDGMIIHGYLTLPLNKPARNLPMIVFVHGGPHGIRDDWSFNPWVQLFANRGYAVLQVNYRGSSGYGRKYAEAGFHHWGTTMQYDVIDGTHWAIKQGYADAKRVCIFGGSYGGFAALRSSELAPDLYRCTVGYDGVYDLPMMFSKGDVPQFSSGRHYLHRVLGDDMATLKAHSPVSHVGRLKSALFLIEGGEDRRAPPAQVEELKAALDKIGKPYQYL
ncbi:MAG TPA: alpha/beta fold hydrolase, partial [Gammaproteobacteria bacterium]|nr:alpha/beta fold hydrolase [Gammaproteobacteria bacterium]